MKIFDNEIAEQEINAAIQSLYTKLVQAYCDFMSCCAAIEISPRVSNAIDAGGLTESLRAIIGDKTLELLLDDISTEAVSAGKSNVRSVFDILNTAMIKLFDTVIGYVKYDTFLQNRLIAAMDANKDLNRSIVGPYTATDVIGLSEHESAQAIDSFKKLFTVMDLFKATPIEENECMALFKKINEAVVVSRLDIEFNTSYSTITYDDQIFAGSPMKPIAMGAGNPIKYCKTVLNNTDSIHNLWAPCYDHMQAYQKLAKSMKNDLTQQHAKYIGKALRCMVSFIVLMALYKGNQYKTGFRIINMAKRLG